MSCYEPMELPRKAMELLVVDRAAAYESMKVRHHFAHHNSHKVSFSVAIESVPQALQQFSNKKVFNKDASLQSYISRLRRPIP